MVWVVIMVLFVVDEVAIVSPVFFHRIPAVSDSPLPLLSPMWK